MTNEALQEALIHEALNGPTPIEATELANVNPTESLPVGIGPGAVQPFMSGASQNVRTTWVEQGWGHDSQRWPTYPFSVLDNPARVKSPLSMLPESRRENFALDAYALASGHENARQALSARSRRSGAQGHGAIVNIPDAVPYTQTVPTYSGGAMPMPGVDVPLSVLYGGL